MLRFLILFIAVSLFGGNALAISPDSVVVVYNSNSAGSERIARHYVEKRGVPAGNLIGIDCSNRETVDWATFIEGVFNPLRAELLERGLMKGQLTGYTDADGRTIFNLESNSVRYMVLCRGVPLRIQNDAVRHEHAAEQPQQQQFVTNRASVDAELSLLPQSETPIIGFVPNPLYNQRTVADAVNQSIIRVTRLDGPSVESAMALVDRALEAEQTGLLGRAYIDIGGRHPRGDEWLRGVANGMQQIGYDLTVDSSPDVFSEYDRFDAPAFYFGWYADHAVGPMMAEGFEFVPGAVGFHIHSFSADTLRSDSRRWAGPLVGRGMTATVGNVWEPFLELTHNPVLFFRALVEGQTLADAAYHSLPVLSWQAVAIGDPLYRPMKVNVETQLRQAETSPNPLSAYAVIRVMNLLNARNDTAQAITLGRQGLVRFGGLPMAIALAKLQFDANEPVAAVLTLKSQLPQGTIAGNEQAALVYTAAQLLAENNQHDEALAIMRRLLERPELPRTLEIKYLGDAFSTARSAGDSTLAASYSTRLGRLKAEELAEANAAKEN